MASEPILYDVEGRTQVTLNGTVNRAALLGHDGTNWVNADSDSAARYYAQFVAMEKGDSGDTIRVCRKCTIYDPDAPYTAYTIQYCSGTAGATTETMPVTSGGNLVQVVGLSLDTARCMIELHNPELVDLWFEVDTFDTTGEPGLGVLDTGWAGPSQDLAGEDTYVKGRLPANMVSLLQARLLLNSVACTDFDLDLTITGGFDGASNAQDTGTAMTTTTKTSGSIADDKIGYIDIAGATSLMDAGFALPGRNFSVWLDMDGVSGGEASFLGLDVICLVV